LIFSAVGVLFEIERKRWQPRGRSFADLNADEVELNEMLLMPCLRRGAFNFESLPDHA